MNDITFKISDTVFAIHGRDMDASCFTVRSVPRPYSVQWNEDLSSAIKDMVQSLKENPHYFLLIDEKIRRLYFPDVTDLNAQIYDMKAVETDKNMDTVLQVIEKMDAAGFEKSDVLYVVGGGITQDIGAFVGSTFKRGIFWKFFPTTLLAMCDSCIGGKSGVNFHNAKNQLGLFSAPREVEICPEFLHTLEISEIRSGLGEILKLSATGGKELVKIFESCEFDGNTIPSVKKLKDLIWLALMVKKAVIEKDEFELDLRRALNYGHTLGHAIEVMSDHKIPHGQAVALGMIAVNQLSVENGLLSMDEHLWLKQLAKPLFDANIAQKMNLSILGDLLLKDKKTQKNNFVFVFITSCGNTVFAKYPKNQDSLNKIAKAVEQAFM